MTEMDKHILQRAQSGDRMAFGTIMNQYQSYAYRVAWGMLLHAEDASDVVQESFIRVWKHLPKYDPQIRFTTWLYQIVMNLCRDALRKRKKQRLHLSVDSYESRYEIPSGKNVEKQFADQDLIRRLMDAMQTLPLKQRMVFVLRDLEDMSLSEIAVQLKISKDSVKTHLYLARKWIRETFGHLYP